MRIKSILISFLILANVTTAVVAQETRTSTIINELHKKSLILLKKYNLHLPDKTSFCSEPNSNLPLPEEKPFTLDTVDSKQEKPGSNVNAQRTHIL